MKTYYCPGSGRISRGQRIRLTDRIRMWKRRRARRNELVWF